MPKARLERERRNGWERSGRGFTEANAMVVSSPRESGLAGRSSARSSSLQSSLRKTSLGHIGGSRGHRRRTCRIHCLG